MWSSTSSTVTAPSRRPSSSTTGTPTRLYVARKRVTCPQRRVRLQRLDVLVEDRADQRRAGARAAAAGCAPCRGTCRSASPAAGGRRRPGGQRGGELDPADHGQRLGDGGLGPEDDRLGGHQAAGGVLVVGQQPAQRRRVVGLHQLQQLLGRLRRQLGRAGRPRRRAPSPRGRRRRAALRASRGSRPGRPRAAPPGRRRAARRRARRRPRRGAWARGRGSPRPGRRPCRSS